MVTDIDRSWSDCSTKRRIHNIVAIVAYYNRRNNFIGSVSYYRIFLSSISGGQNNIFFFFEAMLKIEAFKDDWFYKMIMFCFVFIFVS